MDQRKNMNQEPDNQLNQLKAVRRPRKLYELSDSDDSITTEAGTSTQESSQISPNNNVHKSPIKRAKLNKATRESAAIQRRNEADQRKIERAQKKQEELKNKAIKKALQAAQRKIKPDECVKYVSAQIDSALLEAHNQNDEITSCLSQLGSEFNSIAQPIPFTITWKRKSESYQLDDSTGNLEKTTTIVEENYVLLIMTNDEIYAMIKDRKLSEHIRNVKSIYSDKKIYLGVLKFQRQGVKLAMDQVLFGLTELQIVCNCSYRNLYSNADLGSMISQFTKSIAQKPFKLQRDEIQLENNWYMQGDNKDCVKVDKQGNGVHRLWQQQLTAFPNSRLETAESIIEIYPTLTSLIQAYDECPIEKRELLLADIPIRRNNGAVSTFRHIGKELSKKMNIFYNSLDGEAILGKQVT